MQESENQVLTTKAQGAPGEKPADEASKAPKKKRALWIVLAVLGACMLFGVGAIAGGGAVYGLTRARSHVYVRPLVRWALPEGMRDRGLPDLPERGMIGLEAGAMIVDVVPDGPADQAGLREGDLLVAIDGKAIDEESDLASMIAEYKPGDKVTFEVTEFGRRLGQESREVTVTLAEHPDTEGKAYLGVTFVLLSGDRFDFDGGSFRFRRFGGEGLFGDCDGECEGLYEFHWPRL